MEPSIPFLLVVGFLVSLAALVFLVWSISSGQFSMGPGSASVIFEPGEHGEDPASSPDAEDSRQSLDRSGRRAVLVLLGSAIVWLLLGSFAGLASSLKFHLPDLWTTSAWATFGRVRPLHLNLVTYGWTSLASLGVGLWLMPRLLKTPLRGEGYALAGAALWNGALVAGSWALLAGYSQGEEWLEFPFAVDLALSVAGALLGIPLLLTLRERKVRHLYVSTWYIGAALLWFPWLFLIANWPGAFHGVSQAVVNWWFAHNVLGLWITPFSLGAAYYFIPKILGRPIHSYQLSLLGFWSLALFYSQAGVHHLIGGPVPNWLVAVSVVHSVAMVIPVIAVAINHHMTMKGHFPRLLDSPTLRFVVTGSVLYTVVSLQGCLEALPSFNRLVHFTHYTVAHAHLGVYGFASMILFGSVYFIGPRVTGRDWPSPSWISAHYWLVTLGLALYVVSMTVAGVLQGLVLLDPEATFLASLAQTKPYFIWRSAGGAMMTAGHLIFGLHFVRLLFGRS